MIFLDFHDHILHNTKFTNRMEHYEEMAMRKLYPLAVKHTAISFLGPGLESPPPRDPLPGWVPRLAEPPLHAHCIRCIDSNIFSALGLRWESTFFARGHADKSCWNYYQLLRDSTRAVKL